MNTQGLISSGAIKAPHRPNNSIFYYDEGEVTFQSTEEHNGIHVHYIVGNIEKFSHGIWVGRCIGNGNRYFGTKHNVARALKFDFERANS